jgi:hypothetical protein
MNHTWEQLQLLAREHRRKYAVTVLQQMIAAQGDNKSFQRQYKSLLEELKHE